ncbi:putative phage tail protein [Arthrobacter sp. CAN_A212]|uniref:hypothetical protein n=1 Tax=Arthrobacter sp. CAN_A212 TaxID=2787719 RepID=UPI0018C9C606
MTSITLRPVAVWLLGLSAVLILGGVSLLVGTHPITLALPTSDDVAVSIAYSSDLEIAFDGESWVTDQLAVWGGVLLVGGLMVSAAAAGLRWGRTASGHG